MWRIVLMVVVVVMLTPTTKGQHKAKDPVEDGPLCVCPNDSPGMETVYCGSQIHRIDCNENNLYVCKGPNSKPKQLKVCDVCNLDSNAPGIAKCFTGKMVPSKNNAGEESEEVQEFQVPNKEMFPPPINVADLEDNK